MRYGRPLPQGLVQARLLQEVLVLVAPSEVQEVPQAEYHQLGLQVLSC